MEYPQLLNLFDEKYINIDETSFIFKDVPDKIVRFIGYIPQEQLPYWAGFCDVDGGCEFKTAKELLKSPIFEGKSIKDSWNEIEIITIGAINIDEWNKMIN